MPLPAAVVAVLRRVGFAYGNPALDPSKIDLLLYQGMYFMKQDRFLCVNVVYSM